MSLSTLASLAGDGSWYEASGTVTGVRGLLIRLAGPLSLMTVGTRVEIESISHPAILAEVVGFEADEALALPLGHHDGLRAGAVARLMPGAASARPSDAWLGRVLDATGEPADGGMRPLPGDRLMRLNADPPAPAQRQRLGPVLDVGVRALNAFLPLRVGQRMGLFAGSGVGKSVLMAMIARNAEADVFVIGLVGERGRELREFIEDDLGPLGLARSVVIVATSDEPALRRRAAAQLAMATAEYFRDEGKRVVLLLDSVTRFAMAQREIGLALGEPPTTRGYTPTVFSELPRLLERAGPGVGSGSITAFFTVLVDGGDHDEPVADAVRGILDGHVVLERAIAERGRYPAINILKSVSRTMPGACEPAFLPAVLDARRTMATYADMEELIRLGAYRTGADPDVDRAIALHPAFEDFLSQGKEESTSLSDSYGRIANIVNGHGGS